MPHFEQELTLFIDADDTLWENNIYFEQAVEAFIDFLDHSTLTRAQIKATIDEIELANLSDNGYGTRGFTANLRLCYRHLAEREISDADLATILGFGELILSQEIQLLDGVEETLSELSQRHRLVMLTKGHQDEQRMKIDRSGLAMHFFDIIVVPEKNATVYCDVTRRFDADPAMTWMVGNSPRSDINPARQAGLGAVFIPHERTWSLEKQQINPSDPRLLVLGQFAELLRYF